MKVTVAPDFEQALPEHTDAELAQLEKNVLADKSHIHMPPVIVWSNHKNTVVDGHHQYRIRTKHGLLVKYQKREFDSRQDALREAYSIQLGRRNLSVSQRAISAVEFAKLLGKNGSDSTVILQSAAQTAGVSEKTVWDAKKVIEKCPPEIVKEVKAGNFAASDAAANADLPAAKQKKIAKKAADDGTTLKKARAAAGPSFEPEKLDKQSSRQTPKPKNAKPTISTAQRKECLQLHAKFCRSLNAVGIYDEFIIPLSQIIERLKQI